MRPTRYLIGGGLAAAFVGMLGFTFGVGGYDLQVVTASAGGAYEGASVYYEGVDAGTITDLQARDNMAVITVRLDRGVGPVPSGTRARINWESVIGSRVIELLPPSEPSSDTLPSGARIDSTVERVELDDVFAMLDEPTREELQGALGHLEMALDGSESDLNDTLREAGPTIDALGEVLRAVGEDGPAIRSLVSDLREMTSVLAERDGELASTLNNLADLTGEVAGQQEALARGLAIVPPTIDEANATLAAVPSAVDSAQPLLRDLQPATAQLPSVAENLQPVLGDLRRAVGNLRPTLESADLLLQETPALLDGAEQVVPELALLLPDVQPALEHLRPYTPEVMGWLSNWASLFSNQNDSGNIARALITASASSLHEYPPGLVPPGMQQEPRPEPGSIIGQSWADAHGDEMR